jgi:hypothetical protein
MSIASAKIPPLLVRTQLPGRGYRFRGHASVPDGPSIARAIDDDQRSMCERVTLLLRAMSDRAV